jgi:hypothetical protein
MNSSVYKVAADSEISNENCVTADSEIDSNGGVILLLPFFCWVFTFFSSNINFFLEIKGTRIDSASRFS